MIHWNIRLNLVTVKPVLSTHSEIDKTKAWRPFGILMQVKRTAEYSHGAFCSTFDLHKAITSLGNLFFSLLLSGCLRQVLLYFKPNKKERNGSVGRVLDLGWESHWFETHRRHNIESLRKTLYALLGTTKSIQPSSIFHLNGVLSAGEWCSVYAGCDVEV